MGFGTELQGRASHEALLKVQDAELRLLETVRRFVTGRVEADRSYLTALTKTLAVATKGDNSDMLEFQDCSSVFRAWDSQLKETDNFVRQVKDNSDGLARTLDSISFLIAEKKNARRGYLDQRNSLDNQMNTHQEDVQRNKTEYSKLMERLKVDRAKYQDIQYKGKAGGKIEESRVKLVRSMKRLHQQHNRYVLSLQSANSYQESHAQTVLPATLDCHQRLQQLYVKHMKFVFQDIARLTDFSSEPFKQISDRILKAVAKIDPSQEYNAFIGKYKSEALPPLQLEFDSNLMEDYSGPLIARDLSLDDLTLESVKQSRTQVEDDLKAEKKCLEGHEKQLKELARGTGVIEQRLLEEEKTDTMRELVEQRKEQEVEQRDVEVSQVKVKKLQELLEVISRPLDALGDAAPPTAFEGTENGNVSLDTESNFSASSSKEPSSTKFKFPNKLPVKLPFSKKRTNGKFAASREDLADSGGGGDGSEPRGAKVRGGKGSAGTSYEQADPMISNGPTSSSTSSSPSAVKSGPIRASIMAMKEQGTVLTDTMPLPARRMEDEEWFHGVLPREEVQKLLVEDGDYLVRVSKNSKDNETQYVLSVFWSRHKHFIIQGHEGTGWKLEGKSFPSIQELIDELHRSGEAVTNNSQAVLKKAVIREDWELLNDHIHLEMKIGNGHFGEVYKGVYAPRNMVVAVKTCRDTLSEDLRRKFLQEGRILKQFTHPNIVSFIGIAAQRKPVMIVMEYVPDGALLSFLQKQGKSQTPRQLTDMCLHAASGMEYLEEKGCIHRDLAARNCLVGEGNVIKISDFGMSRVEEEYKVSAGMKQIPIKWTAPEALNYGIYTSLCDVWSYGILMWEIFSSGGSPYPGMTNQQARERIEDGYRLPKTALTPELVYKLMLRTWDYTPEKRPHFQEICTSLKDALKRL